MQPLISVIVPVYGVEKYLKRCVDSIINQSYKNLEIILVDDGSPDSSGIICDEYKLIDSRVRVVHKKNEGLSSARNTGLEICNGDYISFIDSDDFISSFFIEIMLEGAKFNDAQVVTCNLASVINFWDGDNEDRILEQCKKEFRICTIKPDEALMLMLYQKIPNGAQFRLYKKQILTDICFPIGYIFEDVATVHKTFMCAVNMSLVDAKLYAYRVRSNSIVREGFSTKKMAAIPITQNLFKEICDYNYDLKRAAASRSFAQNFHIFLQVPFSNIAVRKEFWKEIKKYRYLVLTDSNVNVRIKNRVGAMVSCFGMNFAYIIGKLFGRSTLMTKC